MRQALAEARVVSIVGHNDIGYLFHVGWQHLGVLPLAVAVAVNVFPGFCGGEGELVGGKADNVAMFEVKGAHLDVQNASDAGNVVEDGEGYPGLWAGKGGKGVEVEVVDCLAEEIEDGDHK